MYISQCEWKEIFGSNKLKKLTNWGGGGGLEGWNKIGGMQKNKK